MRDDESLEPARSETEHQPGGPPPPRVGELPGDVPNDLRDVSFPTAVRGYDRRAVDAYVERVNTAIAELEVSRSPQAAVRHALDRVGEQTSGILQRARETAEEITTSARSEADEISARAKAEAEETIARAGSEADMTIARAKANAEETTAAARAEAEEALDRSRAEGEARLAQVQEEVGARLDAGEKRVRELEADAEAIAKQRTALLEDIQGLLDRLGEVVTAARARASHQPPSHAPDEATRPEPEEAVQSAASTDQTAD